jgi:putative DNA-invertase from lambdoid prophage Rac
LGQIAAIYARVSTADQSCARQVADLTEYARRAGYVVEGVYLETASGARADRAARGRVLALAQARRIEVILVTELSRWGRSTLDLLTSLRQLEGWGVSLVAQSGMTFDLASPHGRMLATMLAGLAEFERDLIRERVRSGIAAAKARGKVLGRRLGDRPVADRLGPQVLAAVAAGRSYRWIARDLGLSKNTVAGIVARHRATGNPTPAPGV